jgi:hypothetical protein
MVLCPASRNRLISRYHFAGRKAKNTKEAFVAYIELVNFGSLCRIFWSLPTFGWNGLSYFYLYLKSYILPYRSNHNLKLSIKAALPSQHLLAFVPVSV